MKNILKWRIGKVKWNKLPKGQACVGIAIDRYSPFPNLLIYLLKRQVKIPFTTKKE